MGSFFLNGFSHKVKMLQKISLAFAIAQSTVYADDHDWEEATGWEFIFPDECSMMKFSVANYDNGIGTDDWGSRDDLAGYCEFVCGESCDNIDSQSVQNSDHCDRLKSGDLQQRYEDEVINIDHSDRDAMMSVMNAICGNLELECAYASYFYSEHNYYDPEDAEESGAIEWCEAECDGSQWDEGIDDFTPPCNADRWVSSFENDDYDHHDDHHDTHDDDHYDDHDDDHHEESSAWEFIFPDECLPAKFTLNNYHHGIGTEAWGSYEEVVGYCEMMCGTCDNLEDENMENSDHCERPWSGDLQQRWLHEVVYHDGHSQPEKDAMMSVVNIMCGNIDQECAHASYQYSLTAYYDPGNSDEMREYCESTCVDQQWERLAVTYGSPCDSDIWSAS